MLCSLVKQGIENRGQWNARWCEKRKEVLVHAMNKDGKEFYTLSNAYKRQSTKGSTKQVPVADDYKKMFDMCDKYNKQIKKRVAFQAGRQGASRGTGKASFVCFWLYFAKYL